MLFDVIIRFLAATGLTILINTSGITTLSVVMSICIFLILEISLLIDNRKVYSAILSVPFVITAPFLLYQGMGTLTIVSLMVLAGFTFSLVAVSAPCCQASDGAITDGRESVL